MHPGGAVGCGKLRSEPSLPPTQTTAGTSTTVSPCDTFQRLITAAPVMAITRDDVLHVATLARLELDESSVDSLARDLDKIVGYVQKLNELDTSDVPPTSQVAVEAAPQRPDEVKPGVPRDQALAEAPRSTDDGFRVPAFVEET